MSDAIAAQQLGYVGLGAAWHKYSKPGLRLMSLSIETLNCDAQTETIRWLAAAIILVLLLKTGLDRPHSAKKPLISPER